MRLIMEVDLAQAEWVCVAYLARELRMIETIEKGLDPHIETGCLISGASREFVLAEHELTGSSTDPESIITLRKPLFGPSGEKWGGQWRQWYLPRVMSIRQAGKKGNHGLNYDEGYSTFSLTNEIDESEGRKIVELYHTAYPRLREWYREVQEQLRRDMTLINCLGSKRVFRLPWGNILLKAAYAFLPQSTVGDVGKIGLRRIYEDEWLREGDRCVIMGNHHDSISNSVRYESTEELAEIITRCRQHMTVPLNYHNRDFTLKVDTKLGRDWGTMYKVGLVEDLRGVLDLILNTPKGEVGVERTPMQ